MVKYSVLDQCPAHDGKGYGEALKNSLKLAKISEDLGFYRYWVAEHHGFPALCCPCPEILIPQIAMQTKTIRVGSGGVMLPHYSPYKVAENFSVLESMYPGRIDLGLGRAPGSVEQVREALAHPHEPVDRDLWYESMLSDLEAYLKGLPPEKKSHQHLKIYPQLETSSPELWLLGSGQASAKIAAKMGAGFAFGLFISPADKLEETLNIYRNNFKPAKHFKTPQVMLVPFVICAKTSERASLLTKSMAMAITHSRSGKAAHLIDPVLINEKELSEAESKIYNNCMAKYIYGTAKECKAELLRLSEKYKADEMMIVNVLYSFEERVNSYKALAKELF